MAVCSAQLPAHRSVGLLADEDEEEIGFEYLKVVSSSKRGLTGGRR